MCIRDRRKREGAVRKREGAVRKREGAVRKREGAVRKREGRGWGVRVAYNKKDRLL